MKNNTLIKWLLGLTIIAQLAVCGFQIASQERIMFAGTDYKFRTRPVDPYDAFRGKYVALGFEQDRFSDKEKFAPGETVYAHVVKADDGYAEIIGLSRVYLKNDDCFKVTVHYTIGDVVYLSFPFEKYFMAEDDAPIAEKAYRESTNSGNCYALVYIEKGSAALKGVYIQGKKIEELVKERKQAEEKKPK